MKLNFNTTSNSFTFKSNFQTEALKQATQSKTPKTNILNTMDAKGKQIAFKALNKKTIPYVLIESNRPLLLQDEFVSFRYSADTDKTNPETVVRKRIYNDGRFDILTKGSFSENCTSEITHYDSKGNITGYSEIIYDDKEPDETNYSVAHKTYLEKSYPVVVIKYDKNKKATSKTDYTVHAKFIKNS